MRTRTLNARTAWRGPSWKTPGFSMVSLSALLVLGGCFSLARSEPQQRHYVLGGEARDGAQAEPNPGGLVIGIRRLRLAPYLDPPLLVIRRDQNHVTYAEYHRWAEPLGEGINRTVARYLSSRSPIAAVDVAPWPAGEAFDYLVQLHVERFEGVAARDPSLVEGTIQMRVKWEILNPGDGTIVARGSTDYEAPGWRVDDFSALVLGLDAGLSALSSDVSASLGSLATNAANSDASATAPTP